MRDKLIFSLMVLSPIFTFSQASSRADSANQLILSGQACTDRIYVKVEMPPALKVSSEDYADTLAAYLVSQNESLQNKTLVFKFVVTCHGEINSIESITSNIREKDVFAKAILHYSNLWLPARQNGYIVNSYAKLTIVFGNNTISIGVSQ